VPDAGGQRCEQLHADEKRELNGEPAYSLTSHSEKKEATIVEQSCFSCLIQDSCSVFNKKHLASKFALENGTLIPTNSSLDNFVVLRPTNVDSKKKLLAEFSLKSVFAPRSSTFRIGNILATRFWNELFSLSKIFSCQKHLFAIKSISIACGHRPGFVRKSSPSNSKSLASKNILFALAAGHRPLRGVIQAVVIRSFRTIALTEGG